MRIRNLLLAAFLALAAAACGGEGKEATPAPSPTASPAFTFNCSAAFPGAQPDSSIYPVDINDDAGRTVNLKAPPKAIVSLSAGHTEILYALGAAGQIAAVDKFSNCPKAAAALPHLDAFSPSVESIAALKPDLVVLFFDPGGLRQSLERLGIQVLFLKSPESVQGVFQQMALLGRATGHPKEADKLTTEMRAGIDAIVRKLADIQQGPTVFHEVDSTYFTAGPGSFVGDLYKTLKARNIAEAASEAYPQINAEAIIKADPQVIILADVAAGESPQTVAARPGWSQITAVKGGRVYTVDPDIVSRPGPRLVDALDTLARLLYPEKFR